MASTFEALDRHLAALLCDWSGVTTFLAIALAALVAYPVFVTSQPDTHPLLLARQSAIAPIRKKNESALYRSPEVPHGYPLRTGLNVKDAGAPRWASGRDGDLRDVWREVQRGGAQDGEGKKIPRGKIMTVLGREEVIEHEIEALSREISVIGQYLTSGSIKSVAVYLPNSAEYLLAIFACAFFGVSPILLPYNIPHVKVYELLNATKADALICAAGNLPLEELAEACRELHQLIWVVEKTSRHMDWKGVPESAQERLSVSVWHDVVQEQYSSASANLPTDLPNESAAPSVTVVWQDIHRPAAVPEITDYTHANLVAATSALISALPLRQRFSAADLVLPLESFNSPYALCQTLAALYTHAALAITSVAGPEVDIFAAMQGVRPTIVVTNAESMAALHIKELRRLGGFLGGVDRWFAQGAMKAGRMPGSSIFPTLTTPSFPASSGSEPGRLRLILISDRISSRGSAPTTPKFSTAVLSDLRIFTRARVCYALTHAAVAGAVAQTHVFDYRIVETTAEAPAQTHFGLPLSTVEIKLIGPDDNAVSQPQPEGEIVVIGPAVSGKPGEEVKLGIKGRFREDGTLVLLG